MRYLQVTGEAQGIQQVEFGLGRAERKARSWHGFREAAMFVAPIMIFTIITHYFSSQLSLQQY